jgi:tRNA(adenine34) deaminase
MSLQAHQFSLKQLQTKFAARDKESDAVPISFHGKPRTHSIKRQTLEHSPEKYMREALKEARKAAGKGEVPVGAVIVKNGKVLGRGHNLTEAKQSALTHAEMQALSKASKSQKSWRLNDCDLYVTLEPCTMCSGAIVLSRIGRLFYGADDPKAGAVVSTAKVMENPKLNHRVQVTGGILKEECSSLLSGFFKDLREKKNKRKNVKTG